MTATNPIWHRVGRGTPWTGHQYRQTVRGSRRTQRAPMQSEGEDASPLIKAPGPRKGPRTILLRCNTAIHRNTILLNIAVVLYVWDTVLYNLRENNFSFLQLWTLAAGTERSHWHDEMMRWWEQSGLVDNVMFNWLFKCYIRNRRNYTKCFHLQYSSWWFLQYIEIQQIDHYFFVL